MASERRTNDTNEGDAPASLSMDLDMGQAEELDFKWIDLPGLIALWVLAVIVFLQFFTRYVLNDSLAWTEEIARYVLIVVAYLGAITVTRKGTHIFLEFFYRYLPIRAGKWLAVAMEAISFFFWSYMFWIGVQLAMKSRTKMASIAIPKAVLYWCVAAGLAVMAIYSAIWLYRKIKQPPEEAMRDIADHALAEMNK